jgi:hypothetical protein
MVEPSLMLGKPDQINHKKVWVANLTSGARRRASHNPAKSQIPCYIPNGQVWNVQWFMKMEAPGSRLTLVRL